MLAGKLDEGAEPAGMKRFDCKGGHDGLTYSKGLLQVQPFKGMTAFAEDGSTVSLDATLLQGTANTVTQRPKNLTEDIIRHTYLLAISVDTMSD